MTAVGLTCQSILHRAYKKIYMIVWYLIGVIGAWIIQPDSFIFSHFFTSSLTNRNCSVQLWPEGIESCWSSCQCVFVVDWQLLVIAKATWNRLHSCTKGQLPQSKCFDEMSRFVLVLWSNTFEIAAFKIPVSWLWSKPPSWRPQSW